MKACRFTERLQQAISISGLIEIYSELNRKGSRFLKNDTGLVKLEIFKSPWTDPGAQKQGAPARESRTGTGLLSPQQRHTGCKKKETQLRE